MSYYLSEPCCEATRKEIKNMSVKEKKVTLKQIRTLYNESISQKEYAELVGIDEIRYQRLERKELRLLASELIAICKLTHADPNNIDFA